MTKKAALIISYPRSGNTWIRYCVEFLSKRPTRGVDVVPKHMLGSPIHSKLGHTKIDNNDPILIKSHKRPMVKVEYDGLLVLVRNYKEVVIRHAHTQKPDLNLLKRATTGNPDKVDYLDILKLYDGYSGKKLLLYYEDIINNLEPELDKLVDFLGLDDADVEGFMKDITKHRNQSINFYGVSKTKGNKEFHHSTKLTKEQKKKWDDYLRDKNPIIYDKYLSRYEESNGDV